MTEPNLTFLSDHILSVATKHDQTITLPQLELIMYFTLKNLYVRNDLENYVEVAYHHDGAYVTTTGPQFKAIEAQYHHYGDRPLLDFGNFHFEIDAGTNKRIQLLLTLPTQTLLTLFQKQPYYKRYLNIATPLTLPQINAQNNAYVYRIYRWSKVDDLHVTDQKAPYQTTIDVDQAHQTIAQLKADRYQHCYLESIEL